MIMTDNDRQTRVISYPQPLRYKIQVFIVTLYLIIGKRHMITDKQTKSPDCLWSSVVVRAQTNERTDHICLVSIWKEGPIISRNPSTFRDSHAFANRIF